MAPHSLLHLFESFVVVCLYFDHNHYFSTFKPNNVHCLYIIALLDILVKRTFFFLTIALTFSTKQS